ncbi:MAG: helicase, partial [Deltaproteobacteria bacterium]|nr:helicase [Deltaproteobacteria bacterium]
LKIEKQYPELIREISKFPPRIKVAKQHEGNELLVFMKKGRMYIKGLSYSDDGKSEVYESTLEEIYDRISCNKQEEALPLSSRFWNSYEKVCKLKEQRSGPLTEQSLEQRALNNLKSFISEPWEELLPHLDFIRTLREDIIDYGTLSDFTLRRIANLEFNDKNGHTKTVKEIETMKKELGEYYLLKEKERHQDLSSEIIIAIENQII